ncbi:MAG: hypothetical protein NVS2B9_11240 [Myxococcales bacterium]
MRPAALVTGEISPYRVEPFRRLAAAEDVEILVWAGGQRNDEGSAVRHTSQAGVGRLIASGRYRAVICGLGGRIALPAAYLGARRARIPFVLWASLWSHPRTLAHAISWPATRHLYRHADAVVTYGSHVSRYVARHRSGAIFEAAQAVSAEQFGAPVRAADRDAARARAGSPRFLALYVGRLVPEKGIDVLLHAWRRADLGSGGALALIGAGSLVPPEDEGIRTLGALPREQLPAFYAAADALILPSVATATFTEPWGLVVNEAMHQGTPIIASDAVGAVAGGLVRDGRNGLVVPAGDPARLAAAIRALALDPDRCATLGAGARSDVSEFSEDAWVEGMSSALRAVGAGARPC